MSMEKMRTNHWICLWCAPVGYPILRQIHSAFPSVQCDYLYQQISTPMNVHKQIAWLISTITTLNHLPVHFNTALDINPSLVTAQLTDCPRDSNESNCKQCQPRTQSTGIVNTSFLMFSMICTLSYHIKTLPVPRETLPLVACDAGSWGFHQMKPVLNIRVMGFRLVYGFD